MTKKEMRFFSIAKEITGLSDFHGTKVGAVVVEGKRILSTGCNSEKTRPLQMRYNVYRHFDGPPEKVVPRAHAEVDALSPLIGKDLNWQQIDLYVYREKRTGECGCSRPCPSCARLIKDLGLRNVYYINENEDFVKERFL